MRVTSDQVAEQLVALLPPGPALPTESGSVLCQVLAGISAVLARVNNRGVDLREEADPSTAFELLAEWERAAGLPDECFPLGDTLQARREILVAKLTGLGGQTPQFYVDLLAQLGFDVTVQEFKAFRVDESGVDEMLAGEEWQFAWRVIHADTSLSFFRVDESAVDEPLVSFGNASIDCLIDRLKPAQTAALIASPQKLQAEDGEIFVSETGEQFVEELVF